MPDPNSNETRTHFIDRCMNDEEAIKDFPDSKQRVAFCNAQWTNYSKMFKTKGNPNSIKDVDINSRTVTGYAASFDNMDSAGDVFESGAFKKSISERGPQGNNRIIHLMQHDTLKPLGKPVVLLEDSKGLYFETKVAKTSYGTDLLKLYETGTIDEHSVGFVTITEDKQSEHNVLKEVKLYEYSSVTWGANSETPFMGFKGARDKNDIIDRLTKLSKAIKNGDYTDRMFNLLEIEFEQLKSLLNTGPEQPTQDEQEPIELIQLFKNQFNFKRS